MHQTEYEDMVGVYPRPAATDAARHGPQRRTFFLGRKKVGNCQWCEIGTSHHDERRPPISHLQDKEKASDDASAPGYAH